MKKSLFDNIDALWRVVLNILKDSNAGEVYILVDALDECEISSRNAFLSLLRSLFHQNELQGNMNVKFLITCRPETEIEQTLAGIGLYLRIDSAKINADISKFIEDKVGKLSREKRYPAKLTQEIKVALTGGAGGTFLWASLVLDDISKTKLASKVREKLRTLPSNLDEVYSRILRNIDNENTDVAKFILQLVVVAR
jgi:hypothetical protein